MKNILILCGAEKTGNAEGRFNRSLVDAARQFLSASYDVEVTDVERGYDIKAEQQKFMQAHIVIYQFPVFWFSCPSSLKKYIDQVFERGVFFERKFPYGSGGLLKGKQYLLSTTWNAPESAFNDMTTFYQGRSLDEALISMHQANRYVGMTTLPGFNVFNVVMEPDYARAESAWIEHLSKLFMTP